MRNNKDNFRRSIRRLTLTASTAYGIRTILKDIPLNEVKTEKWNLYHWGILYLIELNIYSSKLEEYCYYNPTLAFRFLKTFKCKKVKNLDKLEEAIAPSSRYSYIYSINISKKRFPKGEVSIVKDLNYKHSYLTFLKGFQDE